MISRAASGVMRRASAEGSDSTMAGGDIQFRSRIDQLSYYYIRFFSDFRIGFRMALLIQKLLGGSVGSAGGKSILRQSRRL